MGSKGKTVEYEMGFGPTEKSLPVLYCDAVGRPMGWWSESLWSLGLKKEMRLAFLNDPKKLVYELTDNGSLYYVLRFDNERNTLEIVNSLNACLQALYEHLKDDGCLDIHLTLAPLEGHFGVDYIDNLKGAYEEFVLGTDLVLNILKW